MKTPIALCMMVVVLALSGAERTTPPAKIVSDGDVGRYQLFQGEYEALVTKGGTTTKLPQRGVFRIDTKTGQTWVFVDQMLENGIRIHWFPINDDPLISR